MVKVSVETKQEGLRLCVDGEELPSGINLELKIDQKWVLGTYIFDPKTKSHYLETTDQRYQLEVDSTLRFARLRFGDIPFPLFVYLYLSDFWCAISRKLQLYWKQIRKNRNSE